jgi:hypothetical protein
VALLQLELKNYNKASPKTPPVGVYAHYLAGPSIGEHAAHNLREREQEAPRDDLVRAGHQYMPRWAQGQEHTYWGAADQHTRKNGVLGKEILLTLPKELSRAQNQALIDQFLATLPPCPTTWAFHEPRTRSGTAPQPHVHILISPRQDVHQGQPPERYFRLPNHGGVPTRRLWQTRDEVFALRKQWEQLLRGALRAQGLEQTLERHHADKEARLSAKEMKELEYFLKRTLPSAWGHEHTIPAAQLQRWRDAGQITWRQATWIAQRGQRQAAWQIEQTRPQVWDATATLEQARPWQLVTRYQAAKAQTRATATIQTLTKQRQQLGTVYTQYLSPALRQERARYRQEREQQRAQRPARHRPRGRSPQPEQAHGPGLRVRIEGLEEHLARRTHRQRDDGWER